jgi:hypothetical protein
MSELTDQINTQKDFINMKRLGNSLDRLLKKYPEGCPDHVIAVALEMTEKQVTERYLAIISCLRQQMSV